MKSLYAASHLGGADKASDAFCWYESSIATSKQMPAIEKKSGKKIRKGSEGSACENERGEWGCDEIPGVDATMRLSRGSVGCAGPCLMSR